MSSGSYHRPVRRRNHETLVTRTLRVALAPTQDGWVQPAEDLVTPARPHTLLEKFTDWCTTCDVELDSSAACCDLLDHDTHQRAERDVIYCRRFRHLTDRHTARWKLYYATFLSEYYETDTFVCLVNARVRRRDERRPGQWCADCKPENLRIRTSLLQAIA